MNQKILFNDDLIFDQQNDAWCLTGQLSGELITFYYHSVQLKQLDVIDNCTKYDLEEVTELWLKKNDLDSNEIHIQMR